MLQRVSGRRCRRALNLSGSIRHFTAVVTETRQMGLVLGKSLITVLFRRCYVRRVLQPRDGGGERALATLVRGSSHPQAGAAVPLTGLLSWGRWGRGRRDGLAIEAAGVISGPNANGRKDCGSSEGVGQTNLTVRRKQLESEPPNGSSFCAFQNDPHGAIIGDAG